MKIFGVAAIGICALSLISCARGPEISKDEAVQKVEAMKQYIASDQFKLPTKYVLNIESDPLQSSSVADETDYALNLSFVDSFATFFISAPGFARKLYVYADGADLIVHRIDVDGDEKFVSTTVLEFDSEDLVAPSFVDTLIEEASKIEMMKTLLDRIGDLSKVGLLWQNLLVDPFGFPEPQGLETHYYSWGNGSLGLREKKEGVKDDSADRLEIMNYLVSAVELHMDDRIIKANVSYGNCDTSKPEIK